MTALFTVNPDGSNLQQFTEPHDHHKNVEHFVTQLPDEQVVAGNYYPSFDSSSINMRRKDPIARYCIERVASVLFPRTWATSSWDQFSRKRS